MKSESLKRIINMFNNSDKDGDCQYVRIKKFNNSIFVSSYNKAAICGIVIPNEHCEDMMISKSKLSILKAISKEHGKDDVPNSEISEHAMVYDDPEKNITSVMQNAGEGNTFDFTINYKDLDKVFKSIKGKTTNLKFFLNPTRESALIVNEEGDVAALSFVSKG